MTGQRAIFTLLGWLLVSASAHAQPSSDIYYCIVEEATGFQFKENRYVARPFVEK